MVNYVIYNCNKAAGMYLLAWRVTIFDQQVCQQSKYIEKKYIFYTCFTPQILKVRLETKSFQATNVNTCRYTSCVSCLSAGVYLI